MQAEAPLPHRGSQSGEGHAGWWEGERPGIGLEERAPQVYYGRSKMDGWSVDSPVRPHGTSRGLYQGADGFILSALQKHSGCFVEGELGTVRGGDLETRQEVGQAGG